MLASKELFHLLRAFSYSERLCEISAQREKDERSGKEELMNFAMRIKLPGYDWKGGEKDVQEIADRILYGMTSEEADNLAKDINEYLTNRKSLFFSGAAAFVGSCALLLSILALIVSLS